MKKEIEKKDKIIHEFSFQLKHIENILEIIIKEAEEKFQLIEQAKKSFFVFLFIY